MPILEDVRCRSTAAFVGLVLGAIASTARGQPTHYQAILVGDRSSGLGSAFTGLANDASAAYYNPGGLVSQEAATVTGGLILNAYDRVFIRDGVRTDFGDFDVTTNSQPSFPAFAAVSLRMGRRDASGRRPYVLAFSSFRLGSELRSSLVEMPDPATGLVSTIAQRGTYRNTYYGVSLASRFGARWSGGFSLFLSDSVNQRSQQIVSVSGQDPFDFAQSQLATVNYDVDIHAYYGVLRLGALYRASERWRLGFMLQPPGARLKARADVRRQAALYDLAAVPPSGDYLYDHTKESASVPVPAELRLGTAFTASPKVLLTSDLSFVMPTPTRTSFRLDPIVSGGSGEILLPTSTERDFVCNVSLGVQYEPTRSLLLQLGAFTDFSSVPRIPATSDVYQPPRLQRVGFSGSLTLHNQRRGIAIGLIGVLARGDAQAVDFTALPSTGNPSFERTAAEGRTIYFSVTGATQLIQDISAAATRRIRAEEGGVAARGEERSTVLTLRRDGRAAAPATTALHAREMVERAMRGAEDAGARVWGTTQR